MSEQQEQQASQRISDATTARLVQQNHRFLSYFIRPQSPSDVAGKLEMAANLAHHHAKKLAEAGLLFEQRREGGKVYYQLAAREFRVPSALLPPEDPDGNGSADMRELGESFLHAYERSWALMHEDEEDRYGFGSPDTPTPDPAQPDALTLEAHPTHFEALTLRLTPERYQRLARALSKLIADAYAEGHSENGLPCTLALLTFRKYDEPENSKSLSRRINSFLGAEERTGPPRRRRPR